MIGNFKQLYIPDTSVLIKWINAETEDQAQASQLERDFDAKEIRMGLSLLSWWELGNYLGRKLNPDTALCALSNLQLKRIPGYALSINVTSLSFEIMKSCQNTSFYDASQHALAISKKATFITSDEKYYKKAQSFGHIMLLKDYS